MRTVDAANMFIESCPTVTKANTLWFHFFRGMIESGDLARLKGSDLKVYLVIKAHANFETGLSFPEHKTIARLTGLSIPQVKRCIGALEKLKYLTKEKRGRGNRYILTEKIEIKEYGQTTAFARFLYKPSLVERATKEIQRAISLGDISVTKIVQIEKLHVQIVDGNSNAAVQIGDINAESLAKLRETNPKVYEILTAPKN